MREIRTRRKNNIKELVLNHIYKNVKLYLIVILLLIIGIIVGIVVFIFILVIPILLLVSSWATIQSWFGWDTEAEIKESAEYSTIYKIKENYGNNLASEKLTFNGELPMPVNNAVVTSEFGNRIHPITRNT